MCLFVFNDIVDIEHRLTPGWRVNQYLLVLPHIHVYSRFDGDYGQAKQFYIKMKSKIHKLSFVSFFMNLGNIVIPWIFDFIVFLIHQNM